MLCWFLFFFSARGSILCESSVRGLGGGKRSGVDSNKICNDDQRDVVACLCACSCEDPDYSSRQGVVALPPSAVSSTEEVVVASSRTQGSAESSATLRHTQTLKRSQSPTVTYFKVNGETRELHTMRIKKETVPGCLILQLTPTTDALIKLLKNIKDF